LIPGQDVLDAPFVVVERIVKVHSGISRQTEDMLHAAFGKNRDDCFAHVHGSDVLSVHLVLFQQRIPVFPVTGKGYSMMPISRSLTLVPVGPVPQAAPCWANQVHESLSARAARAAATSFTVSPSTI